MTPNHFKTIVLSLTSGAAGGLVGGGLISTVVAILIAGRELLAGATAAFMSILPFTFYGMLYGLVSGIVVGFFCGFILNTIVAYNAAPQLGKWTGLVVGAIAGFLFVSQWGTDSADVLLSFTFFVASPVAGTIGGKLAGHLFVGLSEKRWDSDHPEPIKAAENTPSIKLNTQA